MKKLLLMFVLFCIITPAYSFDFNPIEYRFYGHASISDLTVKNTVYINDTEYSKGTYDGYYTDLGVGTEWGNLDKYSVSFYTNLRTYMLMDGINKNYPYRDIYSYGIKLKYRWFYVKYDHSCMHPVYSGPDVNGGKWTSTDNVFTLGVNFEIKGKLE